MLMPPPHVARRRRAALVLLLGAALPLLGATGCSSDESPPNEPPEAGESITAGGQRATSELRRALRGARPGATIVLRPGVYGRRGAVLRLRASGTRGRPITIRGPLNGRRPRVLGQVRAEGDHLRLRRLVFDGPTGPVGNRSDDNPFGEDVQLWIRGDDVSVAESEVRDNHWHAGIYVTGDRARIVRNHIHDNGDPRDPAGSNLDHGVYWDSGSGGLLSDNVIAHNLAYGVHLYPDPQGVRVLQNTLVENGRGGVILAGNASGNVVANNIVAFNAGPRLAFELSGGGNVLRNNLFWENGGGTFELDGGVTDEGNLVGDPLFAGRGDYRLRAGSVAAGKAVSEFATRLDQLGNERPATGADLGAL